jgi:hypothetical protein
VHTAGALFIPDIKGLAVPFHATSGAQVTDLFLDVQSTWSRTEGIAVGGQFPGGVRSDCFLVDADLIAPGADDGTVGPGNGGYTVVGAAGGL